MIFLKKAEPKEEIANLRLRFGLRNRQKEQNWIL